MSEALAGSTVLVTGGRGFIGRHLVRALEAEGARPLVALHPDDPFEGGLRVDLADRAAVVSLVRGAEFVVHLAARSGGIQFQQSGTDVFEANRCMTDNVLGAARDTGVRRVFLASSIVVYRGSDAPVDETSPVVEPDDPGATPYALSKVMDERAGFATEGLDVVAGRFGNVYGPGGSFDPSRATVVHSLVERAHTSDRTLTVWGDGSAVRSFIYVADVAAAIVRILSHGVPGNVYNVDSGIPVTIAELAGIVRDAVEPDLALEFDPDKPSGAPFRVPAVDALAGIGFRAGTSLQDGVGATVEWYRARRAAGEA